jgi:hypothetical protein
MKNKKQIKETPTPNQLDLSDPEDARWFLDNFEAMGPDGRIIKVTEAHLSNGKVINFRNLTDSEAVQYANEVYMDLGLADRRKQMQ